MSGERNGVPLYYENISIEDFFRFREDWIVWRNLGHADNNGAWVAPVSFLEAQQLPTKMIGTFFVLDDLVSEMIKQNKNKGNRR
jgi:hypothetical protein